MLDANTMNKLNDMFKLFSGINANYSNFSTISLINKMGPSYNAEKKAENKTEKLKNI